MTTTTAPVRMCQCGCSALAHAHFDVSARSYSWCAICVPGRCPRFRPQRWWHRGFLRWWAR